MQTIGRYELVEKLGQGGMGVVYRAFDPLLQRVVALKLIATLEADQELRERFFREARAAGQLSHKNIITIYDLGEHEGQPFLAMEFLEGQDLQQRMTSPARMSLARKLELAIEICEGLEYAHLHGVIHRDIKPANIFITNGGIAKILDFGLARLITSELTNSNMMMGTLNYMAPEQVRGERADHRSDIFSAGVVLYEVLGGRRAFEGDSFGATLYKILEEVPVPLRELDGNLPPELIAIVERAIEKPRETRYQHMGEMLRDLVAYRQHLLITNSPAFGSMTPMSPSNTATTASNAPTMAAPASPRPYRAPSDRASAATTSRPATPAAVSTPPPPAAGSRMRLVAGAAALVLLLGAGATWMLTGNDAGAPEVESAANSPGSPPPDAAAEAARQKAEAIERGLSTARDQLAAGQYEAAAAAAGEVLALEPGNNDARRIMDDASRSRGKGTAEARERMTSARNAAVAAAAQTLAPAQFKAAQAAQREGVDLLERGQQGEATAKFWEASGLFRSAEVAAHTEAAARRERARAQAERASPDRSKEASAAPPEPPAPKPPATTTITPVPTTTGLQLPPGAVPSAPVAAPPPPREKPVEKPVPAEPAPTEQITALLDRYAAALESRSLDALKRIWPGLSGAQESAMRYEFQNARVIEVEVVSPQISVRGDSATVTFTRRYRNVTADGQDLRRDSSATMTVRRAGNAWVIEQLRFAPAR